MIRLPMTTVLLVVLLFQLKMSGAASAVLEIYARQPDNKTSGNQSIRVFHKLNENVNSGIFVFTV